MYIKKKIQTQSSLYTKAIIKSQSMLQASPYCVVQVFGPGKQVEPVSYECNMPIVVKSAPNEQGVHIPQGVAKASISKYELGKRKLQDDIELDERHMSLDERRMSLDERLMQLQTQSIENDKQHAENRISAVFKCMEAMTTLDPSWRSNHRMVLQLQEVISNGILHDYSTSAGNTGRIGGKMKARQRRRRSPSGKSRWR